MSVVISRFAHDPAKSLKSARAWEQAQSVEYTEEQWEQKRSAAKRMALQAMPIRKIARELGVSETFIRDCVC